MNGIFAKPLRGMPLKERYRIVKLAQTGRRIEDPAGARVIGDLIRSELSPRETRSWRWQVAVIVAILAVLFWWGRDAPFPVGGGIGGGATAILVSVWTRWRYRKTARANGWGT